MALQLWVTLSVGKWTWLVLLKPEPPEIAPLTSQRCYYITRLLKIAIWTSSLPSWTQSHAYYHCNLYQQWYKKVCTVHVGACRGGGVLVGFRHSSFPKRKLNCIVSAEFDVQMFFFIFWVVNHVCSPLLSECTAGLFVNLLLTKVDLWEWCCTRRGFSLSSTRFSTFLFPRRSLGGHVLHLLKDARGGEALYVEKPEGYLNDLSNRVCMWWLAACDSDCRFWVVWVLKELSHIDISHIGRCMLEINTSDSTATDEIRVINLEAFICVWQLVP